FRVWDEKDKKVAREFAGLKRVWGWAVSPGGKWLFANGDGVDKLWDLTTGDEAASPVKPQPGRASAVTFLSDDRRLVGSEYGSHPVIEVPSGKEVLRFKNEGGTEGLAYSPGHDRGPVGRGANAGPGRPRDHPEQAQVPAERAHGGDPPGHVRTGRKSVRHRR